MNWKKERERERERGEKRSKSKVLFLQRVIIRYKSRLSTMRFVSTYISKDYFKIFLRINLDYAERFH